MHIPVNIAEFGENAFIVMCAYKEEYVIKKCTCGKSHTHFIGYKPTFIHIENESLKLFEIVHLDQYPDLLEVLKNTQPADWGN